MLKIHRKVIGTETIKDLGIKTIDIGAEQVTTPKIASGNITEPLVGSGAVTYTKLDLHTKRERHETRIAADSAAADTWERGVLLAAVPVSIVDAGIIPDSNFGLSSGTTISVVAKGLDGLGTQSKVAKTFTAVSGYKYVSLGTITSGYVASGEAVTFKKAVGTSGDIVPASVLVLNVERVA